MRSCPIVTPARRGTGSRSPVGALLALLVLAAPSLAPAQAGIRVLEVERVRVDGSVRDWGGATFARVGEGSDASMRFALGHDAEGLYVAAQVWDDRLVRTPRPGTNEDAVILTLSIPQRRGRRAVDVYLYAGVTGRGAASAAMGPVGRGRPRPLPQARVVEGPLERGSGYTLEAFLPFSALPGGDRWDEATASIRLRDVDSESHPQVEAEPSLVTVDAQHLDRLVRLMPSGGASGALGQFLASHGIEAARPTHDLRGDVGGDAADERVFVVDGYVVVAGSHFRDGGYAFHHLAVDRAADVRSAELRDLTGDGKQELIVVIRQRNAQGERDLWQVVSLSGNAIGVAFSIEVRKAVRAGSVEARVRVLPGRGARPAEIEARTHRATGLDAATYQENPATDVEPILLPWGPILSRRYRWSGRSFERVSERPNPRYRPLEATPPPVTTPATRPSEPAVAAPDADALLAAFRRERGIRARARPRFRFRTNLAGAAAPETALVYGRQLVVVGEGVQGGRSWLYYEIPAPTDGDLLNVAAADVTGDGRAELLFRLRQSFGDVTREVLVIHQITPRGFPRLLQVEVARRRGDDHVENAVQTRGGVLTISPGRARGFGADAWPFTRDTSDSVEPLLLPWSDRAVRYRLQRGRLVH